MFIIFERQPQLKNTFYLKNIYIYISVNYHQISKNIQNRLILVDVENITF